MSRTKWPYLAAAISALVSLASCENARRSTEIVSLEEYSSNRGCWFADNDNLEAFMALADNGNEQVPWFISSRCIAKGDMPSYGAATVYLLGYPRVVDPTGLLRKQIASTIASDNVRLHLPLPSADSKVYLVQARLAPAARPARAYNVTEVQRAVPLEITFGELLEMGPSERSALLARVT